MLSAWQFGFRKQMSTESTVFDSSDHGLGNFERGKYTIAAFLHLSKAFDTLNRSQLNRKIICSCVNGNALEWFVSCFSQRKQFVNVLDVSSPTSVIDICIAHRSCFDSHMFIIKMTDNVRCSNELNFLI